MPMTRTTYNYPPISREKATRRYMKDQLIEMKNYLKKAKIMRIARTSPTNFLQVIIKS